MQLMGNGFLQSQGYSKAVMFDPARPAESLSSLANAVFKRQFGLKINSEVYIKPAVTYVQVREKEHNIWHESSRYPKNVIFHSISNSSVASSIDLDNNL